MKKSTEDISRLPKWAQFLIRKLQADVADYKATAHKVQTGKSKVYVEGGPLRKPRYLPDNEAITFRLANGRSISTRLVLPVGMRINRLYKCRIICDWNYGKHTLIRI